MSLLPKRALKILVDHALKLPESAHVVCAGVYDGGDILAMAGYRPDLRFTAIDSFQGLDEPTELDGTHSEKGMFAYDFDDYLERTKDYNVFTHKMWITESSMRKLEFDHIDMLWMDLDHAEPTRCILKKCLPHCTASTPVLTHDYTNENYPGIKVICDKFGKWDHIGHSIAKRRF